MLTPTEIMAQLQECLSKSSDLFSTVVSVSSASVSSQVLTLTIPAHTILVGDQILINEAFVRNKIDSVSLTTDDTLRFTTLDEHDLTAYMSERAGNNWPDGLTVDIENLQEYSLDTTAAGVPSSTTFETQPGYPLPTLTGNEYLLENRALSASGWQTVTSVTTDTIVITLTDIPPIPDGSIIITEVSTYIRITIAPDAKRAEKMYTKHDTGEAWGFLIMADRDPSKDRENTDDLNSLPGSSLRLINIIQRFSFLVILPTNEELSPIEAQSIAYVDLFQDLISCLYGWQEVGYSGDGQAGYNTSYYLHAYDWFKRDQINFEDGYENTSTVAWRILDLTNTVFDEGNSNVEIEL